MPITYSLCVAGRRLKNTGATLPLRRSEPNRPTSIVMIGPTWEIKAGGYSGRGTGGPYTAPTAAFISRHANTTVLAGCMDVSCTDGSGVTAAVTAAAEADIVLVAIGESLIKPPFSISFLTVGISTGLSSDGDPSDRFEAENNDRRALSGDIGMPGHQGELVSKVAAAARKPVIVVVTGSSLDLTELKHNKNVGAILWRGYSGEAAGMATADVLFGTFNPSGRLTSTFYPQSFVTAWKSGIDPYTGGPNPPRNASYFDHHVRPNSTTGKPG